MIDLDGLAPDAPAIILLCSSIGAGQGTVRPLGPRAWAGLAERLTARGVAVRELAGMPAGDLASTLDVSPDDAARYVALLERASRLAFELDRLRSRGIWVVTIADAGYPGRLRERLGPDAPPVLFGAGPLELVGGGGVAIVGSRDVDATGTAFAERLAGAAARGGTTVISGGARGIDVTAMRAASEAGGSVVGVLPEGIERRLRAADTRSAVASGQAALVSPYHPGAGFSQGAAMGRNKIIYALADAAVVVSSAEGSGGTWTGALEAMTRGWVPVLVRDEVGVPAGNRALIEQGAFGLDPGVVGAELTVEGLLAVAVPHERRVAQSAAPYEQERLFDLEGES